MSAPVGISDVELARVPRTGGELVLLLSSRPLGGRTSRRWLTLQFDRCDGSAPRFFTVGMGEFAALRDALDAIENVAAGRSVLPTEGA